MALVRIVALAAAGFAAFGCATTSGSSWVSQPEPGLFANDELSLAVSGHPSEAPDESPTSGLVSELDGDRAPPPRPRLDRTVTLGEVHAAYPERADSTPVGDRAPVTVVINNTVNVPSNAYDGYYAGPYFSAGARPVQPIARPAAAPAPTHPGQNWPAIPSYGPSFPFKTAPASPWR